MPADSNTPDFLSSLESHFSRFAVVSSGLPLVLSLWVLATHIFGTFDAFPYLAITSPTKRCGKTRLAELLELVCANPLRTVGISAAALFRTIEETTPTLVIDEAESLRGKEERSGALREILNAGYRKGQQVVRCVGGNGSDYKTRTFQTFCPKVLVLIGPLPDTLADRCISIPMKRRTTEYVERFRLERVKRETGPLRSAAEQWAKESRSYIDEWYQENDVDILEDREAELWLPLFAICAVLVPERLEELKAIALRLSEAKTADEPGDLGIRLIQDIRRAFHEGKTDRFSTEDLLSKLNGDPESPWPGWNYGKALSSHNLGRMLAPFGVRSGTIRFSDQKTAKGYYRDDFADAWERYLPPPEQRHNVTMQENTGENENSPPVTRHGRDGAEKAMAPNDHARCDVVTDQSQAIQQEKFAECCN